MWEREGCRKLILENIKYDILVQNERMDRDRLNERAELIVDTACFRRKTIRIARDENPAEVVKSRFLEAEQFPHRVCVGPYAGEQHLCPQHQEISAGYPE